MPMWVCGRALNCVGGGFHLYASERVNVLLRVEKAAACGVWAEGSSRKRGRKKVKGASHTKEEKISSICAERHECTFRLLRANFLWVGIGPKEEVS